MGLGLAVDPLLPIPHPSQTLAPNSPRISHNAVGTPVLFQAQRSSPHSSSPSVPPKRTSINPAETNQETPSNLPCLDGIPTGDIAQRIEPFSLRFFGGSVQPAEDLSQVYFSLSFSFLLLKSSPGLRCTDCVSVLCLQMNVPHKKCRGDLYETP